MANIDRIVNVQISLNTTGISTEGFSTLLCVGPHMYGLTRVSTYTDPNQMIEDGFSADDALYRMVSDAFAQTPSPAQVKVGRQQVDGFTLMVGQLGATSTYVLTVSNTLADGTIRKKEYSYTNSSGSESDILKGILQAITSDNDAVLTDNESQSAEETLTELHLEAKNPGTAFSVKVTSNLQTAMDDTTETITFSMAKIVTSDSDFYGVALASRVDEDILAMAEWA